MPTVLSNPVRTVLTGHTDYVDAVVFGPDGRILATGGFDGVVRLWDVATRKQVGDPLASHAIPVMSAAFSPDGRILAVGGGDGKVRLWDVGFL